MQSENENIEAIKEALAQAHGIDSEPDAVATPEFLDKLYTAFTALTTSGDIPSRADTVTIVLAAYKLITENHNLRARLKESLAYIFEQHAQSSRVSFAGRR